MPQPKNKPRPKPPILSKSGTQMGTPTSECGHKTGSQ